MESVPWFIPIRCSATKCVPWCAVHEGSLKQSTESVPPSAPRPAGLAQGCRKAPCLLISVPAAGSHQVPGQVPQINASPDQCSGKCLGKEHLAARALSCSLLLVEAPNCHLYVEPTELFAKQGHGACYQEPQLPNWPAPQGSPLC